MGVGIESAYLDIVEVFADRKCRVGRQGPWGRSPGKDVGIDLSLEFKLTCDGGVFYFTVATRLVEFVLTESRAGCGREGLYRIAFVEQSFVVKLLEEVPKGLNVVRIKGDVGIF